MNKKISIVILNYNNAVDTIDCLNSLSKIIYNNYNIIIVDNNSLDNSLDTISNYLKSIHIKNYLFFDSFEKAINTKDYLPSKYILIKSKSNDGYGHGNNMGIQYSLKNGADYVLVLNNDTIVKPGFLEPMVEMCEKDKTIGIASGKIYFYDKPNTIWFNGGKFSPCTAKVEHFNFNEKDIGQISKTPITFISGCMWLIPKKVFQNVGFINEEYFMYVEDLEYCQRVLKKGYKLEVYEEGNVYHKVGSSTGGKYSSFSVFWRTRNMNKFISTIDHLHCRILAYIIFNLKSITQLIIAKKIILLKDYTKAIFSNIKE